MTRDSVFQTSLEHQTTPKNQDTYIAEVWLVGWMVVFITANYHPEGYMPRTYEGKCMTMYLKTFEFNFEKFFSHSTTLYGIITL